MNAVASSVLHPLRRWGKRAVGSRRVVAGLLAATAVAVGACSSAGENESAQETSSAPPATSDYFGYLSSSELLTTNGGSAFGVASSAAQLSGRLYPAAFLPGPGGQLIPNTDLVKTEEFPGDQLKVLYTISDDATFSDGVPVTCDDYLLAYTAGVMPVTFASHEPMMDQIQSFDCAAGNKRFMITFEPGQGARWRYLFGPGTVMPSHTIAKKVGMSAEELVGALYSQDSAVLEPVATTWRYGFNIDNFDPGLQVSYGPYVIDRIGKQGEVVLHRNDKYYGDQAPLKHIVVWPKDADVSAAEQAGTLRIADTPTLEPAWLNRDRPDNPYQVTPQVGELTDTLRLSDYGLLGQPWARQAFAACIDHTAVARASSQVSGVDVPPVYVHALNHADPLTRSLDEVIAPRRTVDMATASGLAGNTIRIGYLGPNERLGAMVEQIRSSCEPAGITVEDASAPDMSAAQLAPDPVTGTPKIDAFLGAVDPLVEYGTASARISAVDELKEEEARLWEELPAIPLSAQPRVFILDRAVGNVLAHTGAAGIGWNMDRWFLEPGATGPSAEPDAEPADE